MANNVKVNICQACIGKGKLGTGAVCSECRGSGVIGTDGSNEYYIGIDSNGRPSIVDIKASSSVSPARSSSQPAEPSVRPETQKSTLRAMIVLIFIIIIYAGFTIAHFTLLKNNKLFALITVIAIGSILLLAISSNSISNRILSFIMGLFVKKPNDFITEVERRLRAK